MSSQSPYTPGMTKILVVKYVASKYNFSVEDQNCLVLVRMLPYLVEHLLPFTANTTWELSKVSD